MSKAQRIESIGHKRVKVGSLQADVYALLANFSTLMNFLLGAIVSLGIILNHPLQRYWAMRCIMLGASFDAIDGRLARRSHTKPKLGAQFDTAGDLSTFGLAPALLIFDRVGHFNANFALLLAAFYLYGAWFRLSRFMLTPTYGYFNGMASPVAATFVAAWYVQANADIVLFCGSMALISTVMIVSLPYTAMKVVDTIFQKANFVFTICLMLLLTYSPNDWMEFLAKIWIINVLYYTIFGPYFTRRSFKLNKAQNATAS